MRRQVSKLEDSIHVLRLPREVETTAKYNGDQLCEPFRIVEKLLLFLLLLLLLLYSIYMGSIVRPIQKSSDILCYLLVKIMNESHKVQSTAE